MKQHLIINLNKTLHQKYILSKAALLSLFLLSVSALGIYSYKKGYIYHEIDSYALPIISIQYRASIFMNESDLLRAQKDFPRLYNNINSFEDLRSAKLMITKSGKWESFYFPVVAIGSLPFKLLLSSIGKNQEYCFILFNIFCVSYLLLVIMLKKDFSLTQKLFGFALIFCSPLFLYVRYIGAETMIFVLASISMLRIYEHKYNRAAIAVTIAGLANPTIMFLGIASIIDFILYFFQKSKGQNLIRLFITALKTNVFFLVLCFIPSFIPFIVRYKTGLGSWLSAINYNSALSRWLAYIFDINLGFCSFCPILVLLLIFTLLINLKKRNCRILIFYAGMLGTMLCYSLMPHINHGMLYCARYVFWSYGMLIMITLLFSFDMFRNFITRKIVASIIIFSCALSCVCLCMNKNTHIYYLDFHKSTKKILSYFPNLYNPLHSTFYNRTLHIDDDWYLPTPIIYMDSDGSVRKILTSKKDSGILKESLKTSNKKDETWLIDHINKLSDKKSYISIPRPRTVFFNRIFYIGEDNKLLFCDEWFYPFNGQYISGGFDKDQVRYLNPNGHSFGPYISLPVGSYTAIIKGKNLSSHFIDVYSRFGDVHHDFVKEGNDNTLLIHFTLQAPADKIEIFIRNEGDNFMELNSFSIQRDKNKGYLLDQVSAQDRELDELRGLIMNTRHRTLFGAFEWLLRKVKTRRPPCP